MPHIMKVWTGYDARTQASYSTPKGPGFDPNVVARIYRLEIIASTFDDPGEDWSRFDAYDKPGTLIASAVIPGY